jgi:hypothetical protein
MRQPSISATSSPLRSITTTEQSANRMNCVISETIPSEVLPEPESPSRWACSAKTERGTMTGVSSQAFTPSSTLSFSTRSPELRTRATRSSQVSVLSSFRPESVRNSWLQRPATRADVAKQQASTNSVGAAAKTSGMSATFRSSLVAWWTFRKYRSVSVR